MPPTEALYTRGDLCTVARERGFMVTERLITDWVRAGLLDAPARRGLGRGKGQLAGTWPEEQLQLLLLLVSHRSGVSRKHLSALTNFPVSLWAIWGDDYVPLRQVRRALRTWSGRASTGGRRVGEHVARSLTRELRGLGSSARDRDAFIEEVARQFYRRAFDRRALRPFAERLFDPRGTGEPIGPSEAQLNADIYLDIVEAKYAVVGLLQLDADEGGLSDAEFYSARAWYHTAWAAYVQEHPRFAADPTIGHIFKEPGMEMMVNSACENIVLILGLQRKRNVLR